jgi:NAD(P)-dependent dehydrogenase (short-subunit alcohol dehydrogenase family)
MASFQGKVIAITGAASGMGLATAKLLAERGATLALADVQEPALKAAAEACKAASPSVDVSIAVVDVRDSKAVETWIQGAVQQFGRLDGAANIAGVFKPNLKNNVAAEEDSTWDFVMDINLKGVMSCMRAELKHLQKGGAIVNAASILGLQGSIGAAAYSSSKHGVIGLTRSSAKEAGPLGIRVNCFCP